MKKSDFVIIFYPRTGSTFLVKVLNSCSNIVCHSELFQVDVKAFKRAFLDKSHIPEIKHWFQTTKDLEKVFKYRNRRPIHFLNRIYGMESQKSVGFKFYPKQGEKIMNHVLEDRSIKKIFIRRENLLKNFVSHKIASKTGKWDRYKGEQPILNTVNINTLEFQKFETEQVHYYDKYQQKLINTSQEFLDLTYEQITSNFPVAEIESFIDTSLEGISFDVNQKKQNPFELQQLIENYEEVNDYLISKEKVYYLS